ncbi:hypothetical protein [Bradyrhizobium sp. AZCC 2289]|uniref:hypothetical protein n=1 Tax=Bradyrhizobium sp. AZCC 2289 TaxID=3117026 RepID=UPI002FF1A090
MTETKFREQAKTLLTRIAAPAMLGGHPISKLQAVAASAPDDGGFKDRIIYMLLNDDCSLGRLGEGKSDRPLMSMAAYLINTTPQFIEPLRERRGKKVWPMTQSLIEMIRVNGGRMSYVVLADDLSKQQAQAGEQALFALMGLRKHGGWLINETRR